MNNDTYFSIGYINKTHGLKGGVQILCEEEPMEVFFSKGFVFLEIDHKAIPFFITEKSLTKNTVFLTFEDVNTVQAASKLTGKKVLIPIELKPKGNTKKTYRDLTGFSLIDAEKGPLGSILNVLEMPQQYIAVLEYNDAEIMIPLNEHIVRKIDAKNKKVIVALPEGLLDIYLNS